MEVDLDFRVSNLLEIIFAILTARISNHSNIRSKRIKSMFKRRTGIKERGIALS